MLLLGQAVGAVRWSPRINTVTTDAPKILASKHRARGLPREREELLPKSPIPGPRASRAVVHCFLPRFGPETVAYAGSPARPPGCPTDILVTASLTNHWPGPYLCRCCHCMARYAHNTPKLNAEVR
jgi:hypothetical protein